MAGIRAVLVGSLLLGLPICPGAAASDDATRPSITPLSDEDLRIQLLSRRQSDQEIRRKLIDVGGTPAASSGDEAAVDAETARVRAELRRIDRENQQWLKMLIESRGWPKRSQVGAEAAQAAFLIAQHASEDLDFQKQCLALMQELPDHEVARPDVALLTDRVRLAEGKKQLYGSQVELRDGQWVMRPCEEPENVDQRRAEMGLPPMADYLKLIRQVYDRAEADNAR